MKKVHCQDMLSSWGYLLCGVTRINRLFVIPILFEYIAKKHRCRHCDRMYKESK